MHSQTIARWSQLTLTHKVRFYASVPTFMGINITTGAEIDDRVFTPQKSANTTNPLPHSPKHTTEAVLCIHSNTYCAMGHTICQKQRMKQ